MDLNINDILSEDQPKETNTPQWKKYLIIGGVTAALILVIIILIIVITNSSSTPTPENKTIIGEVNCIFEVYDEKYAVEKFQNRQKNFLP